MADVPSPRDRDEAGRPRNARPRDALGRPLPLDSADGVPRIPDDLRLTANETLSYATELISEGRTFNAHEVFEAAWKNGPDTERLLWQSLAQLAVGITHVQRGNAAGATTLLQRAADGLNRVERPVPHAIDADGLSHYATELIGDVAAGVEIGPDRLRPPMTKR